jgi:hypothetical protein
MASVSLKTLARVIVYPLLLLIGGAALGLAAYPQVVGHKVWMLSWAYRSIFNPPEYDAARITRIARERLLGWWKDIPGFRIVDQRDFGEEAREFLIEHLDSDGTVTKKIVRIWVRWKLWTQNNGEDIIYKAPGPDGVDIIEMIIEANRCEHCG